MAATSPTRAVPDDLEPITATAARLGVTTRTVRHWISDQLITGYRLPGGRLIRVSRGEVDSSIRPIPTGPAAA